MSRSSTYLFAASALALSAGLFAAPSFAQTTSNAASDQPTEVVVTGQRASHRSRLDTLAPVDVVKMDSLQAQGTTELAQGLSRAAPSVNFPRPSGTDATDSIRPVALRGLSPDQTLVLVDGKRRHTSALVNINGSMGRGSAAVDLNAIPESALDRLEVLRDGASAQYGSDAIAGVVNLHLREADHGGGASVSYGEYDTSIKAANSSRDAHDGGTTDISAWSGFKLGSDGFLTLSAEARYRRPTSRGDIDQTVSPAKVTSRYGDPQQKNVAVFANWGKPLNDTWTLYGNANFSNVDSKSAAFFRHAGNSGVVASLYPNGFLPIIEAKSQDIGATLGIRGSLAGWASDFSLTHGQNRLDYYTHNSDNASYGDASKRDFYDGRMTYGQTVFNADFSRPFDLGLSSPTTIAFGLEARHEDYSIMAGEEQSYAIGPLGASGKPGGAQGFGGFQPSNEVDKGRDSVGVYADLGGNFTDKFSYDAAVRYENYSDFGNNTSGKLALRYDFTPSIAIRGSVSSGFRAPSLQQQYFTSTASNLLTTGGVSEIIQTGTFPATSAAARALGAQQLKAETSTSEALGLVYHRGPFELTVDGYNIRIGNRIVLSENILASSSSDIATLLAPYGVSAARFFMNGVTTTTSGVDAVANYRIPTDHYGRFNLSLAWANSNTVINRQPSNNVLATVSPAPALFARTRQYILTNGSPENKGTIGVDWTGGAWSVNARATYYGDVIDAGSTPASDIHTGKKTITDLSGSYRFAHGTVLTVGADNLFDVYPDKVPANLNVTSGNGVGALAFDRFSPFGFNGRYLYAKVSHNW